MCLIKYHLIVIFWEKNNYICIFLSSYIEHSNLKKSSCFSWWEIRIKKFSLALVEV